MTRKTILTGFAVALIAVMVRVPIETHSALPDGTLQLTTTWTWIWSLASGGPASISVFLLAEILGILVLSWLALRILEYHPPRMPRSGSHRFAARGAELRAVDLAGRRIRPRMHPDDWLN